MSLCIICMLIHFNSLSQTAYFEIADSIGCSPFTVQFNNLSTNATSYYWSFGNGAISNQENPSHTYYSIDTYNVVLYAYNEFGLDSFKRTVYVKEIKPKIQMVTELCVGQEVDYNSILNYNLSNNYFWDFGDGNISTYQFGKHHYSDIGTYNVKLYTENSHCGLMIDSLYVLVTDVLNEKEIHLHSWIIGNQICVGEKFPYFYDEDLPITWDFGDGNYSNSPYPDHFYEEEGIYNVIIEAQNFCGNTILFDTTIIVTNEIYPQVMMLASKNIVCPNEQIRFWTNFGFDKEYYWNFNDGTFGFGPEVFHSFENTGIYNVNLNVVNKCGNSTQKNIIINVLNDIEPSPFLNIYPKKVCPDEKFVVLTNQNFVGYLWNFNAEHIDSSSFITEYGFSSTGVKNISLTVSNSCGLTKTVVDSINVVDTLFSEIKIGMVRNKFCIGEQSFFEALYEGEMKELVWKMGDNNTYYGDSVFHVYSNEGVYQVKLIAENYCGKKDSIIVDIEVNSSAVPYANFSFINNIDICYGDSVNFINKSSIGNYFWDFGDGSLISNETNPYHTYSQERNYIVTLSVTNNCGNFDFVSKPLRHETIQNTVAQFLEDTIYSCVNDQFMLSFNVSNFNEFMVKLDFDTLVYNKNSEIVYDSVGIYKLFLYSLNECSFSIDSTILIVQEKLEIPDVNCEILNDTLFATWNIIETADYYSYSFDFGLTWESIYDTAFAIYTPETFLNLLVRTNRDNGCLFSDSFVNLCTLTSIKNHYDIFDAKIYPNPVKNDLKINILTSEEIVNLKIYNYLGESILFDLNKINTNNVQIIFKNRIQSGIYLIRLNNLSYKLVVL
jgi:PKD repeat protein